MIELLVIGPTFQRTMNVQWIRAFTPTGNLIIQPGHVPVIMLLSPSKNIELGLPDGSIEYIELPAGILKVTRTKATIIADISS